MRFVRYFHNQGCTPAPPALGILALLRCAMLSRQPALHLLSFPSLVLHWLYHLHYRRPRQKPFPPLCILGGLENDSYVSNGYSGIKSLIIAINKLTNIAFETLYIKDYIQRNLQLFFSTVNTLFLPFQKKDQWRIASDHKCYTYCKWMIYNELYIA